MILKNPFGDTSLRTYNKKRYQYVGKEKDAESGLIYYGARYYTAWTCRFISVDPLAAKFADLTPYNYAGNKPINKIDIDGLQEEGRTGTEQGGSNPSNGNTQQTKSINAEIHFVQGSGVSPSDFDSYISNYTENLETVFNGTARTHTDSEGNTSNVNLRATYSIDNIDPSNIPTNSPEGVYYVLVRSTSGVSEVDTATNIASMNVIDGATPAAHEFLHQLGLADRYNYYQKATVAGGVSQGFESVFMSLDQSYDPQYFGNESQNIMSNGGNQITNQQFDIIFSGAKESLDQYTFFGYLSEGWNQTTGNSPLGVDSGGNYSASNSSNQYKLRGFYNMETGKGSSFGNKILNFNPSNTRYNNTNAQNIQNAMAPYNR